MMARALKGRVEIRRDKEEQYFVVVGGRIRCGCVVLWSNDDFIVNQLKLLLMN